MGEKNAPFYDYFRWKKDNKNKREKKEMSSRSRRHLGKMRHGILAFANSLGELELLAKTFFTVKGALQASSPQTTPLQKGDGSFSASFSALAPERSAKQSAVENRAMAACWEAA